MPEKAMNRSWERAAQGRIAALAVAVFLSLAVSCQAVPGMLEQYHDMLTSILKSYVRVELNLSGVKDYECSSVDYARLKAYKPWTDYMEKLAKADQTKLKIASEDDRKAFWINTYNAMVLDAVIGQYPLHGGIQTLKNVWQAPHPLARGSISLEQVEDKLRSFGDVRVFFAICSAARSAPELWTHAYGPTTLEEQLERAVNNFCANPQNLRLDKSANELHLSSLFERYGPEFSSPLQSIPSELASYTPQERAVLAFLLKRIPSADRQHILSKRPKIVYENFDWSLNDTR